MASYATSVVKQDMWPAIVIVKNASTVTMIRAGTNHGTERKVGTQDISVLMLYSIWFLLLR